MRLATLQLHRGISDDIPFVMATERLPEYDKLVGRWDEAQHQTALSDNRHAYFLARLESEPIGFAIIRDWASPERVVHIKRVVVARPGIGLGTILLDKLVDIIFRDTDAHRIWLGVFPTNARARRAYENAGFQAEGIARGSAFFGGSHRDELIMSLIRTERPASSRLDRKD
ncbi:MAG TPA: GNAT family N-acetyltransferase [Xanthobacteraceae bacterium]